VISLVGYVSLRGIGGEGVITSQCIAAASDKILERAGCSSNALDSVSQMHTPQRADLFAVNRSSQAVLRAPASLGVTSSPVPKNIPSGVCQSNAELGITSLGG
jgi:hypothetical protein